MGRNQLNHSTQKRQPTIHREMSKIQRLQAEKQKEYVFSKLACTYDWRSPNGPLTPPLLSISYHKQIYPIKPSHQLINPALSQSSLGFLMQLKELLVRSVSGMLAKTQILILILIGHL